MSISAPTSRNWPGSSITDVRHRLQVPDRAVGHQEPMLNIERLFVVRSAIERLPDERDVIRMGAAEHQFDRGHGARVIAEDSIGLFGPEYFVTRDMPVKAARVA